MMLLEPPQSGMQRQSLLIYYISNLVMVGVKFDVGCFDQISTVVNCCQLLSAVLLNVVNCCQPSDSRASDNHVALHRVWGEQGLEVRLLLQELQQANLELQQPLAKLVDQP